MLVKLTNALLTLKGQSLLINTDKIVSVYSGAIPREPQDGDNVTYIDNVTFIHMPPHGTWEVSESLDEVLARINGV
jgi:hypothetical protein